MNAPKSRLERSRRVVVLVVLGLGGCSDEPCGPFDWQPATPTFESLTPVLPIDGKARVCGMRTEEPRLYVGHPGRSPSELREAYASALLAAGFEEVTPKYGGEPGVEVFRKDEVQIGLELRRGKNGIAHQMVLHDQSERLAKKSAGAEADRKRGAEQAARRDALAEQVAPVIPSDAELAELEGAKPCAAGAFPDPLPELFAHDFLLGVAAGEERTEYLCARFGELALRAEVGDILDDRVTDTLSRDPCEQALAGDRPIAILAWKDEDLRPPVLVKAGTKYDSTSTFEGGTFTGRVLLWSPSEREVLCHAPVVARSEDLQMLALEANQEGNVVGEHAQEELVESFKRSVQAAAQAALEGLRPEQAD